MVKKEEAEEAEEAEGTLDGEKCRAALTLLRHAKWFQVGSAQPLKQVYSEGLAGDQLNSLLARQFITIICFLRLYVNYSNLLFPASADKTSFETRTFVLWNGPAPHTSAGCCPPYLK